MSQRPGISLAECLVALFLLTVGATGAIAGAVHAQRTELWAWRRIVGARVALAHLEAFERSACPTQDSSWTTTDHRSVSSRWRLRRVDSIVELQGVVEAGHPPRIVHLALAVRRRCR